MIWNKEKRAQYDQTNQWQYTNCSNRKRRTLEGTKLPGTFPLINLDSTVYSKLEQAFGNS